MKKNGFIATSLIYSFFLIFITLFLTIVADYLQNKVLLNEVERGIKNDINSSLSIKDFEVGDMVGFISDCESINTEMDNAPLYVIANVVNKNADICNGTSENPNSCLILYGVMLGYYPTGNTLTYKDIQNDIDYGYRNDTYYEKIIYNFDTSQYNNYYLGNYYFAYKGTEDCSGGEYVVGNNCIKNSTTSYVYRERIILSDSEATNKRFNKCLSSNGTYYIEYSE